MALREYRAQPSGLGWVLQERRLGLWLNCYRYFNGGEVRVPVWFDSLDAAKAEAVRRRNYAAELAAERQKIVDHERKAPVEL